MKDRKYQSNEKQSAAKELLEKALCPLINKWYIGNMNSEVNVDPENDRYFFFTKYR